MTVIAINIECVGVLTGFHMKKKQQLCVGIISLFFVLISMHIASV